MRHRAALTLVLVALVTAGACGGDSASDKAMTDVCAARDDIAKNVDQLNGLTLTSATTSQVTDNLQAIRNDLKKIGDAQRDLSEDRRRDVQAANKALASSVRETVSAVGKTASLETAAADVKSALQQLEASYRSTFGALDCS